MLLCCAASPPPHTQNVAIRKVKVLKAPKFDLTKLMDVHGDYTEEVRLENSQRQATCHIEVHLVVGVTCKHHAGNMSMQAKPPLDENGLLMRQTLAWL